MASTAIEFRVMDLKIAKRLARSHARLLKAVKRADGKSLESAIRYAERTCQLFTAEAIKAELSCGKGV